MTRELLIEKQGGEVRVAIMEDGLLADLIIERENRSSLIGNIYLGIVERVIKGIGAAFINLGRRKSGFLPLNKINDNGLNNNSLYEGAHICVQVKRDEFGEKGPQLSTEISLPGRLLVYRPTGNRLTVSRQIVDKAERERLMIIINQITHKGEGFVLRTLAEGEDFDALKAESEYLRNCWGGILKKQDNVRAPNLLYSEVSPLQKAIREHAQDDVLKIRFDDNSTFAEAKKLCNSYYPTVSKKLDLNESSWPIFDEYNLEEEIEAALKRKIPLPSGGGLVLESVEALTAIDVNSGRFTEGSDPDDSACLTNLEAAKELSRQVRLRNLGGLIIIDFIHMEREKSWERVLETLRLGFSKDRVSCRVVGRTEAGLVELIRRRTRAPLSETLLIDCPECNGDGRVWKTESLKFEVLRSLKRESKIDKAGKLMLNASPEILDAIDEDEKKYNHFAQIGRLVVTKVMPDFGPDEYEIFIQGEDDGDY